MALEVLVQPGFAFPLDEPRLRRCTFVHPFKLATQYLREDTEILPLRRQTKHIVAKAFSSFIRRIASFPGLQNHRLQAKPWNPYLESIPRHSMTLEQWGHPYLDSPKNGWSLPKIKGSNGQPFSRGQKETLSLCHSVLRTDNPPGLGFWCGSAH